MPSYLNVTNFEFGHHKAVQLFNNTFKKKMNMLETTALKHWNSNGSPDEREKIYIYVYELEISCSKDLKNGRFVVCKFIQFSHICVLIFLEWILFIKLNVTDVITDDWFCLALI